MEENEAEKEEWRIVNEDKLDKNKLNRNQIVWDEIKTAHIDAYYKNGEFIEMHTGQKVRLEKHRGASESREGIPVRIVVPLLDLPEEEFKKHAVEKVVVLLKAGAHLFFKFNEPGNLSPYAKFEIELQSDLKYRKKGNKLGKLDGCACELVKQELLSPSLFEKNPPDLRGSMYNSLNQCFTIVSARLRPEFTNHNCNVYNTFYDKDGHFIESIRPD